MTSNRSFGPLVTVLDFDRQEVRRIPMDQAIIERDENCRCQGHYFATGGTLPRTTDRCICGDITYAEWQR